MDPRGLQRFIVLFFIELSTRKVEIAGIAAAATGLWIGQIGRNLTDAVDGILKGKRYQIHDPDPLFTTEFLKMLAETGVTTGVAARNEFFYMANIQDDKETGFNPIRVLKLHL